MNQELRKGSWMQTASGIAYYPGDPRPEDVKIEDIAHALGKLCRFGGHCKEFYSVAEHSVLVSQVVPREHALQALLHDATEAYVVDIPRPLKAQLSNYAEIEDLNWQAICAALDVEYVLHPSVKEADNNVLLAEKEALLGPSPGKWSVPGTPAPVSIRSYPPGSASRYFMDRYRTLTRERLVSQLRSLNGKISRQAADELDRLAMHAL